MGKFALAVASAVLLSSATALAATSAAANDQMQHSATPAKGMATTVMATKAAARKKAVDADKSHKAMASKKMAHKAWHKTKASKAAWHPKKASTGEREVQALNLLEAAGYRSITGVHPKGMNIMATAVKAGKTQSLKITPDGKILPTS